MNANIKEVTFNHVVLEGTAYEAGKMQGEWIRQIPPYAKVMTSLPEGMPPLSEKAAAGMLETFDKYCPGLNEEIRGFADGLGVKPEQVAYYLNSLKAKGACSQMAILPKAVKNGHTYVGRSYEWSLEDDMRLCTTRIKGKAAHTGFSVFLFGRLDGMNEHGLCVTMSAGTPGTEPQENGFMFWAIIRRILDTCRNIDEALEVIAEMPTSFNWNLVLTHKSGEAALVEIACSHRAVKRIGPNSDERFVCATNQYMLPDMLEYDTGRMWQSVARYNVIKQRLEAAGSDVNAELIRSILSNRLPDGVCCHHYSDWLGTLWSIIYDVTEGNMEVCFGSPQVNPWRTFTAGGNNRPGSFAVKIPDEPTPNPESFYRKLKPGEDIVL